MSLVDEERHYTGLKSSIAALITEGSAFAATSIHSAPIRAAYKQQIADMAKGLLLRVELGNGITPSQAARRAYRARIKIRKLNQSKMSDVGRALAELAEKERRFGDIWRSAENTVKARMAKQGVRYDVGNSDHVDEVAREFIGKSGKSRGWITPGRIKGAGAALFVVSLALIGMDIYVSQDKSFAVTKNIVSAASGGVGFWAGAKLGGAGGSALGPAGTIGGAIVGGIVFAIAGEEIHSRVRGMRDPKLDSIVREAYGAVTLDEDRVGREILNTFTTDINRTRLAFAELNEKKNADVDEITSAYTKVARNHIQAYPRGILRKVLANRKDFTELLVQCLDEGWTTSGEEADIRYLRSL